VHFSVPFRCFQLFIIFIYLLIFVSEFVSLLILVYEWIHFGGRRGRGGMVVGFTTTYAVRAYHH